MMAPSFTALRRNKLMQMIVTEGSAKVAEVAQMFHVSTETIRKDLLHLEREGLVHKSHGGAIASSDLVERSLAARESENVTAKGLLAQAAVSLVAEGSVIILDAGSTTLAIAKLLAVRSGYTIITNSVSISQVLASSQNKILLVGGEVRGSSLALVGLWSTRAFEMIKADVAFLGTDGFLSRNGPCTSSVEEAAVKQAMLRSSKRAIVVCDSSKFDKEAIIQFCPWKEVDLVLTDSEVDLQELEQLEKLVKVSQVPIPASSAC